MGRFPQGMVLPGEKQWGYGGGAAPRGPKTHPAAEHSPSITPHGPHEDTEALQREKPQRHHKGQHQGAPSSCPPPWPWGRSEEQEGP